jgi:hypothetical protein
MYDKIKTAVILFAASFFIFSLFSWERFPKPSRHFHFLDLANSFLNGRLDTDTPKRIRSGSNRDEDPEGLQDAVDRHLTEGDGKGVGWNDWASIREIKLKDGTEVKGIFPWGDQKGDNANRFVELDGTERVIDPNLDVANDCGGGGRSKCDETRHFVSFPPFPAAVMIPFFLIWGYNFNDVIFTLLLAALNTVLLFLLLEKLTDLKLSVRSKRENAILSLLFSFGTVNFFSAIRGEVWFTALIIGISLNLLFLFFSVRARFPFLAGLCAGFGMATRTPLMFAPVFFFLELLLPEGKLRRTDWGEFFKKLFIFSIPFIAVGILLMICNYVRFGNPLEFGHTFLMGGQRGSIREHGLFSSWFLPNNLAAALSNFPVISMSPPFIHITRHGLSLLVTTPALILLFWPRNKLDIMWKMLLTALIVSIPILFYQNTGWAQFGYRFALDFIPYFFVFFACGNYPLNRTFWVLALISFGMNAFGAITFDRMGMFYYD